VCLKRRRVTVYDRVPIAPVPCNEVVFDTFNIRLYFVQPKKNKELMICHFGE